MFSKYISLSALCAVTLSTFASSAPVEERDNRFEATAKDNIVVYYGQTPAVPQYPLNQVCADPNVSIVILAFLTHYNIGNGYPLINIMGYYGTPDTYGCDPSKPNPITGMADCSSMAQAIKTCQSNGIKVMISWGGAIADGGFLSETDATNFADKLWSLFGAGSPPGGDPNNRPFGPDVFLDGFDIDNESKNPRFTTNFVAALRHLTNTAVDKQYYISATPQCYRGEPAADMPDASNPDEMLQAVDYVFIQFFNNPPCGLEVTPNGVFTTSVGKWMAVLAKGNPAPKLYIGAPACPSCAGSGYLEAAGLKTAIANAKAANPGLDQMLGGIMLWDGSQALLNGQYTTAAMQALGS